MRRFYLAISEPLSGRATTKREDYVAIDPQVTSLRWSTTLPGGYNGLLVGLDQTSTQPNGLERRYSRLSRGVLCNGFDHLQLYATGAGTLLWEGRLTTLTRSPGGIQQIEGQGYAVTATADGIFTAASSGFPSGSALAGQIITSALQQAAPILQLGGSSQFQDTGVTHQATEFDQKTLATILDQIAREGNLASQTVDYAVWENRVLWLLARNLPLASNGQPRPQYAIPFDDTVSWVESGANASSSLRVAYTDVVSGQKATTPIYTDSSFATRYNGLTRGPTVIQGGTMSTTAANQVARTMLAAGAVVQPAVKVARTFDRGLELRGGAVKPAYLARAGEWVQIGSALDSPPLIIVRAEVDASSQTISLDLGTVVPGGEHYLVEVARQAALLTRGINPTTGASMLYAVA